MAYQVLARKYRPQRFSDVIGQDHVTRTLLNALSQSRIAHGYIFSGHRGIGKTTIARILAKALNCQHAIGSPERPSPEPCDLCDNCREIASASRMTVSAFEESHSFDVEEIDSASRRGIEDAKLLTNKIERRPLKSKYRILIFDEAHQITDAAWNSLLKTLEEPPEWAVFMFATTQPEDIPQTIRSRCQHFSFHAVKLDDIVAQLRRIATAEHIQADDATLSLLAEAGDGSMRDALSIMDQAIASAFVVPLTPEPGAPCLDSETWAGSAPGQQAGRPQLEISQVRELMGSVSNVVYEQILEAVHANNSADVLAIPGRLLDAGNGAPQLARQFVRYLRNTIVAKITMPTQLTPDGQATGIAADLLQISPQERARAARSAALFTEEELARFLAIMLRTFDDLGYRQEQRFHLELGLLKLVHMQRLVPIEDLLSQLSAKPISTPTSTPTTRPIPTPGAPRLASETWDRTPSAFSRTPPPPESDPIRKTLAASFPIATSTSAATEGSLALADHPSQVAEATHVGPQLVATSQPTTLSSQPESAPAATTTLSSRPESSQSHREDVAERPAVLCGGDFLIPDLATLQSLLVAALAAAKGQQSASEQIEDATLSLEGDSLTIQTTLSKTMLPVVFNAEAERILRSTLREQSPTVKFMLLPGASAATPSSSTPPRKPRAAASGSAAELAEKHPIVQQARRLFSADISNVIDLRDTK